jgi:hypothetical protein
MESKYMSTPANRADFHLMVGIIRDSSEPRGTIGACRYLEVLEGDFFNDLEEAIFRFYESEIRFRASLALDKPADIPRIDGA